MTSRDRKPRRPRFYLVDRADLRHGSSVVAKVIELPVEAIHIAADYESPEGGSVTLHLAHIPGLDVSEWVRRDDVRAVDGVPIRADYAGYLTSAGDVSAIGSFVIDTRDAYVSSSSMSSQSSRTWGVALYTHRSAHPDGGLRSPARFDTMFWTAAGFYPDLYTRRVADLYADRPHHVARDRLPREGVPGALLAFDVNKTAVVDGWSVPRDRALMSPQFVPRPGTSGPRDGYIVAPCVSDHPGEGTSGDELWIFDARDLARGPICTLGHPLLDLARTLHTTWLREPRPTPTSLRRISLEDDLRSRLAAASPDVRAFLERALELL